ncbi:hypothetical protein GTA08_BOTSDO09349 [Botryosphaeria dothidea]|uniref:Uncharacterized protein n=1 Tax=Botryosphaeria dothidea TaxID=55169 RepID=A0A8H4N0W7_9PEZI|nr:hypothetical protein GTA08_BOTSDO09349 [Botryosphaeria dothidea]
MLSPPPDLLASVYAQLFDGEDIDAAPSTAAVNKNNNTVARPTSPPSSDDEKPEPAYAFIPSMHTSLRKTLNAQNPGVRVTRGGKVVGGVVGQKQLDRARREVEKKRAVERELVGGLGSMAVGEKGGKRDEG